MSVSIERNRATGLLLRAAEATWANAMGASLMSRYSLASLDLVMLGSVLGGMALFRNPSRLQDSPTFLKVSVVALSLFLVVTAHFSRGLSLQEREINADQSALEQILMGFSIGLLTAELMSKVLRTNEHTFTYGAVFAGVAVQAIHDAQVLQASIGVQRRAD